MVISRGLLTASKRMSKHYLFLYNAVSALGWAYVFALSVSALLNGKTPAETWSIVEVPLKIVQTLAFMEILHSLFRIVKSPLGPSLMQVSSRLFLLWAITNASNASKQHWSLFSMIVSWSLVEVPRYTFYALNLYLSKVPYPVFFLRYSLFFVLYPTGITGELLQIWNYMPELLKAGSLNYWYLLFVVLCLYVPGSPFMYFHMVGQRASAFSSRSRPPVKPNGIEFPVTDKVTGERGTTETNKGCFAACVAGIDNDEKKRIEGEKNWRFRYNKYVLSHATLMASKDASTVVKMAQQGLDYVHNTFEFVRDGKTTTVAEAMRTITSTFYTGHIKGTKPKPTNFQYSVDYLGKDLTGKSVEQQLDAWVKYGVIEQDTGDAIKRVCNTSEYLDLTDQYFVLLGATSAMGPLKCLLALGANIIAVDIDRPNVWKKLIEEEVRPSFGSIYFPMKKEQNCDGQLDEAFYSNCGCNLITQPAEIRNWLINVLPGKPLTVGGYAYLDGLLHVKLAISMDAIMQGLCQSRGTNVSLAFLCTPTDVHMIPKEAHEAAKKNLNNAPWWQKLLTSVGSNSLKSNVVKPIKNGNEEYYLVDGITVAQGPNYALAKRMQHWRCIVARSAGHLVSTNIAPSTKTTSVVSNTQFKAAYEGMPSFRPMEIMYQETSNAVMGALLINDLRYPGSVANPKNKLSHPLLLFAGTGFHGGLWRCAFNITSIGLWAALIHYFREYKFKVLGFLGAVIGGLWYVSTTYGAPHHWPIMNR